MFVVLGIRLSGTLWLFLHRLLLYVGGVAYLALVVAFVVGCVLAAGLIVLLYVGRLMLQCLMFLLLVSAWFACVVGVVILLLMSLLTVFAFSFLSKGKYAVVAGETNRVLVELWLWLLLIHSDVCVTIYSMFI